MKITIQIKNVYGKEAIYPICEKGKIFAEIAGTKTLTRQTIQQIKSLGYEIEVMQIALD
jgi:copper chaperone CopZ